MVQLIESVYEYAQNNPFGFTLDLTTMQPVKYGITVAFIETQNSFDKESLNNVLRHSLDNSKIVGGWYNSDNGKYYFDSIKLFKNSELQEAIEFAKANKQIAIFDLTNLEEIIIEG